MSATEADLDQLSEGERAALETYITVTGQAPTEAVSLLRRSEWNVQVGLQLSLTGDQTQVLISSISIRLPYPNSLTAKVPTRWRKLALH